MTRIVLFGLACLLFAVATFVSWYQGSNLVDSPSDWLYTAIFSKWLHDGPLESSNISQLDFFVYSIKYHPVFPILMMVSFVYIFIASSARWFKKSLTWIVAFLMGLLIIGGISIASSPTDGGRLMMLSMFGVAILLMVYIIGFRNKAIS
ncbi:DUF4306 domain-containing protein [Sutcliffiella rhizosphaerae]|uniref:DUF4306 domain-containing protein n=1 Tax=Sutcliffiella rhizosphaerae TaxID=2880967 RepID=A0ABN8ABL5_9BACI|nr:DUF4306 domain-containing protein [Sutcliffiella rhizosphaerae]CAG9621581.1 hypothetical protein BACCIP111883_02354 [Sutcliffiella rhizosphaerae]